MVTYPASSYIILIYGQSSELFIYGTCMLQTTKSDPKNLWQEDSEFERIGTNSQLVQKKKKDSLTSTSLSHISHIYTYLRQSTHSIPCIPLFKI